MQQYPYFVADFRCRSRATDGLDTNAAEGPISEKKGGSSLFFKMKERTIANGWNWKFRLTSLRVSVHRLNSVDFPTWGRPTLTRDESF